MNVPVLLRRKRKSLDRKFLLLLKYILQGLGIRGRANGKQVIIVAGVQRSGTNMMMEVLERSYDTCVFNDWDSRAFESYELRSPDVIHSLIEGSTPGHVVLKVLLDLQYFEKIMAEYDPVKILWIVRDYQDVVNSQLMKWGNMANILGAILDGDGRTGWRARDVPGSLLEEVGRYYHSNINEASACALFWYFRNYLFFEQGLDKDARARIVSYEDLVSRPAGMFSEVFEFLELPYSPRVSAKVFSTSVKKQQSPDIEPEIDILCSSLMKRFSESSCISGGAS
jgi:hypothetical protein